MYRFLLLLLLILFLSCQTKPKNPTTHFHGVVMTIPYHIIVGCPLAPSQLQTIQTIIDQTFDEVNRVYNKWNPSSELSQINDAQAFQVIPLSSNLYQFLLLVDEMVALSDGRFDPSVEPVQKLWKESLENQMLPAQVDLEERFSSVGWDTFHFTPDQIWKEHANSSLDLGGIAKGFAIDLIAQRIKESGYENIYVEWGGEIATRGEHPDQRPWRVLVTKYGVPGDTQTIVELHDNAIATSGNYLQNWTVDQTSYCHIFNPKNGSPLQITQDSICSVTIVAPTCLLADTIATSAMLFQTKEEAETWLASLKDIYPELKYWVYTETKDSHHAP